MNNWGIIAVGASACLVTCALAYLAYKKETQEDESSNDEESENISDDRQTNVIKLMDQVIVDSLEQIYSRIDTIKKIKNIKEEAKASILERYQIDIENKIAAIEEKVCEQNGWNMDDYNEQIDLGRSANNEEIIRRVNTLENIATTLLAGEKLIVQFTFDPILTKELTITLYRWILISHLYILYQEIRKHTGIGETIDKKKYNEIMESLDGQKEIRRYNFFYKLGTNY